LVHSEGAALFDELNSTRLVFQLKPVCDELQKSTRELRKAECFESVASLTTPPRAIKPSTPILLAHLDDFNSLAFAGAVDEAAFADIDAHMREGAAKGVVEHEVAGS
jgi:hypothetical protein